MSDEHAQPYILLVESFHKARKVTFATRATGSAVLSMQIDIWPQVVGKTN